MFFALAAFLQDVSGGAAIVATQSEQRADLALRRTWDGRQLAYRFICGDASRRQRVVELDEALVRVQGRFVNAFGHPWRSADREQIDPGNRRQEDIGRKDDCRLRDSFAAGMTDYENGLLETRAALANAFE